MKFKSEIVTQVSGSIGGTTYAHNRGGMYRRARSIPTNPQTSNQNDVRNALTTLVGAWSSTLTQAERDAWDLYGQNVPVTDALGDSINLTGQQWYIGNNTARLQAVAKLASTALRVDTGPTIFDRGDFTNPGLTATEASGVAATLDTSDAWANEDDAWMFMYEGAPQNAGRNFFKGPYRLVGEVEGDSTTAPTVLIVDAATLTAEGYTITEDQKLWLAFVVVRADGRATLKRVIGPTVVAA